MQANPFQRPLVRAAFMLNPLLSLFGCGVFLVRDEGNEKWRCRLSIERL